MNMTPLLAVGLLVAFAGCASAGTESSLEYDGQANGSHSDSVKCSDSGKIKGSGNVADGEVRVTLTDSAGKQLFQRSFKGTFTLDPTDVSGASGSWAFSAQRTADDLAGDPFSGKYAFYVDC